MLGAKLFAEPTDNPGGDKAACDQGDQTTASYLELNLKDKTAVYKYKGSTPTALALTVTRDKPERIYVRAESGGCYCKWYLDLQLSVQENSQEYRVQDGNKPFITAPDGDYPYYVFNGERWATLERQVMITRLIGDVCWRHGNERGAH